MIDFSQLLGDLGNNVSNAVSAMQAANAAKPTIWAYLGDIGTTLGGAFDALQATNAAKPTTWETLTTIFNNIDGLLDQITAVFDKFFAFIGSLGL